MNIFSTLAQLARHNEEDVRTTKKKIGMTVIHLHVINKIGREKHVGYCNLSEIIFLADKHSQGLD